MDIQGSHIFINSVIRHPKINYVKYRQFIQIPALLGTGILFKFFFNAMKN